MLWHRPVHRVVENNIRLTRGKTRFDKLLEQGARIGSAAHFAGLGRFQVNVPAIAHGFHKLVGQQDTVMQVQSFLVDVTRRLSVLKSFIEYRLEYMPLAS